MLTHAFQRRQQFLRRLVQGAVVDVVQPPIGERVQDAAVAAHGYTFHAYTAKGDCTGKPFALYSEMASLGFS